jgi:3-phenylpropionate/cinnamic acid dioxygenase small subunit
MSAVQTAATELLYREAHLLDAQEWDGWLALYMSDCEFWMPAWKSEHVLTDNPRTEVSLIYYGSRAGLEDRVLRVRSGRSVASTPLPRTQHGLTNIVVQPHDDGTTCTVLSNWTVHQFRPKQQDVEILFGRYRHELKLLEGEFRIRRKKIVLLNDSLHTMIDFYSL